MGYREPIFTGSMQDAQRRLYGTPSHVAARIAAIPRRPDEPDPERPALHGRGPVEASTCLALLPSPLICWDVNGYYRSLGVHWKATKKELREAYQRLNGQSSKWLTYVIKQLLDKDIRRAYDRMALGEVFLDDYVREALHQEAIRRAAAKRAAGQDATPEAELSEMGYVIEDEPEPTYLDGDAQEEPPEVVDEDDAEEQSPSNPPAWAYAFYRWRTRCTDTDRLREWQELLVLALGRRGENIKIAVGYHGRTAHPWLVGRVGFRTVVFLNDREQPTPEMAEAASDRVVEDQHGRRGPAALPHTERSAHDDDA